MVQQVKIWHCLWFNSRLGIPQLRHRLQLWLGFNSWPGTFHMPRVQPKKTQKTKKQTTRQIYLCVLRHGLLKKGRAIKKH